jgi:hypothetical protein
MLEINALNLRWRDHMLTLRAHRVEAGENLLKVDLFASHPLSMLLAIFCDEKLWGILWGPGCFLALSRPAGTN